MLQDEGLPWGLQSEMNESRSEIPTAALGLITSLREAFKEFFLLHWGGGQDRSSLHFFFSSKTWSKMA